MSCTVERTTEGMLADLHNEMSKQKMESNELLDYLMDSLVFLKTVDLDGWKEKYAPVVKPVVKIKRLRQSPVTAAVLPFDLCTGCGSEDVIDDVREGQWVCITCGLIQQLGVFTADSAHCSYDQLMNRDRVCIHRYNRLVHFLNVIRLGEGNSRPEIDSQTKSSLQAELAGKVIDVTNVIKALRDLKLSRRYRRHVMRVVELLGGDLNDVCIPATCVKQMAKMLLRVQFFFDKHRKKMCPTRKVFFSYKFLLYQFLHELGYESYTKTRPLLLKSPTRLAIQREMYRYMCNYTGFTLFP